MLKLAYTNPKKSRRRGLIAEISTHERLAEVCDEKGEDLLIRGRLAKQIARSHRRLVKKLRRIEGKEPA